MGGSCTIELQTREVRGSVLCDFVIGSGHMDGVVFDEGFASVETFKILFCRLEDEIAAPEASQIHVDASLNIRELYSLPLLPQGGQGFFGRQPEIFFKPECEAIEGG